MISNINTMTSQRLCFALSLVLAMALLLTGASGAAEDANLKADAKPPAPDKDTAYLMASSELARIARETKDSVLMLAAARLEAMASTQSADRSKTTEGEAGAGSDEKADRASLYSLAEEYAGTNETLLALIDASRGDATMKGRVGGPASTIDRVLAGATDTWRIRFRGNELAQVSVIGDGDTDLDLYVYDENGNLICRDIDGTDQTYCSWFPRWAGSFTIKVENLGGMYNQYRLVTN